MEQCSTISEGNRNEIGEVGNMMVPIFIELTAMALNFKEVCVTSIGPARSSKCRENVVPEVR